MPNILNDATKSGLFLKAKDNQTVLVAGFNEEALYLHGLNLLPALGPARLFALFRNFGNFKKAYSSGREELLKTGLEEKIVEQLLKLKLSLNLELEAEKLKKENIQILTFKDSNYPKLLMEIPKSPPILYYKGTMNEPEELCVSVVGTRKITTYGRTVTPSLVLPLANLGITIVSGMAFGIDALAQQTAIEAGKRTIAVLGGGLDEKSIYPKHHTLLSEKILEAGGALLSEYPPGTPNFKQNFVARNRIISGLSVATAIIECDLESGSLITAKYALDQNRNVYAVPGPIYSVMSQGPNNLLKMGAKPFTSAEDILDDLNLKRLPQEQIAQGQFGDSPVETQLLKILSREPLSINELIKQSGLPAAETTSALTFLEMKGKIKNLGGQQYILSR